MDEIIIRPVNVEDSEAYIKLNNLVWKVAYKHIFPEEVFIDRDNRLEEKVEEFKTRAYNDNTQIVYVAEHNGKLVGQLSGRILSFYEHFKERGYADLMALYVHPDYQGKGISSKFKKLFIDWAKKNGATKFVIGVLKENTNARKIYEKWGGKLDLHTQPFVKLGIGYEEVFYTYELN